jgi:hypothetical protein
MTFKIKVYVALETETSGRLITYKNSERHMLKIVALNSRYILNYERIIFMFTYIAYSFVV